MSDDTDRVARLGASARRLCRHLDLDAVALTGGMAIAIHVAASALRRHPRPINDLDFVACGRDAVSPSVTADFLVSHFHAPHPGYSKFMVQLVDPDSRVRVDIFPGNIELIDRARSYDVSGVRVRVLDAQAVLDHKLSVLTGATEGCPVDKKHLYDAVLLGQLCGRRVKAPPANLLCREEYCRDTSVGCARCDASAHPAFPLAAKAHILNVLGYV